MKVEFLTVTELKQKASEKVHDTEKGIKYIITREGRPVAVLQKFSNKDVLLYNKGD